MKKLFRINVVATLLLIGVFVGVNQLFATPNEPVTCVKTGIMYSADCTEMYRCVDTGGGNLTAYFVDINPSGFSECVISGGGRNGDPCALEWENTDSEKDTCMPCGWCAWQGKLRKAKAKVMSTCSL